jgi:hypothetical protein
MWKQAAFFSSLLPLAVALPLFGQGGAGPGFNERAVERRPSPEDRAGIYMLDFFFKDPRVITVDIPGRGRSFVWYLWYQVGNATGEPRRFYPSFVWVCHDTDTVHYDEILPTAMATIRRLEDPDNLYDVKNSVTIWKEPIPVSKEFNERGERIAFPKLVTGAATWANIDRRSTQFSILVFGLSDGFTIVDDPDGKPILRKKALKLNFRRLGDELSANSNQIQYQGFEWIYATSDMRVPVLSDPPPAKKPAANP